MDDLSLQLKKMIAYRKLQLHSELGGQLYQDRHLVGAIEHYRRALEAAEICGIDLAAQSFQKLIGICLFQLGRLKEAVVELGPFLSLENKVKRDPDTVFGALIHYIQAAQRLPVRFATLESAYAQASDLLRGAGVLGRRHEILVHRARLETLRGELAGALMIAQEAIALKDSAIEDFGQVWDFHYDGLVSIYLLRGDAGAAAQCIDEWRLRANQMPANREIRMARCLADLRRFEGLFAEASHWAEIALNLALQTDYTEVRVASFQSFVRCRLLLLDFVGARAAMVKYASTRWGDSELDHYSLYLLCGDFYLAYARCVGGQTLYDDQLGNGWPIEDGSKVIKVLEQGRIVEKAHRCFRKARKIGLRIDAKLKCECRSVEIEKRQRVLEGLCV